MPATDTRTAPLARLLLAQPGQGDPYKVGGELSWLGILAYEWQFGSWERDTSGLSKLEFLPGVGLVCRPYVNAKDTRLSQYSTSGGSWDEEQNQWGSPQVYRLVQYDSTAGVQFSATSNFALPKDPHFAFSLALAATPSDWDSTTYPAYVRLEFAAGQWAIHVDTQNAYILRKVGASWEVATQLPGDLRAFTAREGEERLVYVRTLRGRIWVSTDGGKTYVWGGVPNAPTTFAASQFTLRGQGGMVLFGLHQILYNTGWFQTRNLNTLTSRDVSATPNILNAIRRSTPTGTSITLADASVPVSSRAAWKATLTPTTHAGTPFTFYESPELYSVLFEYSLVLRGGDGAYTEPFKGGADSEGDLEYIQVTKPYELDQGNASVRVRRDASRPFVWNSGRWNKVQILLGHANEDGSEVLTPAFTGYLADPAIGLPAYNDNKLRFRLENLTHRFKRTRWTKRTRPYFYGITVNQALDRILFSEGLFDDPFLTGVPDYSRFRLWHVAGNMPIPQGTPEEPNDFELPSDRESKWETIERLCGLACVEFGNTDDGVLFTIPKDAFSTNLSQLWEDVPTAELIAAVLDLGFRLRSEESATAVEVYSHDEWGQEIVAYQVNARAEETPGAADFCPWRETVCEELDGANVPGAVIARAQSIARQTFPLKFEADLTTLVRLGVSRRDQGVITGFEAAGISPADRFAVLSLTHEYNAGQGIAGCSTRAGLRRLT